MSAFWLQAAGVINLVYSFYYQDIPAISKDSHFIAGVILICASAIVYAIQSTDTKP